MSCSNRARNGIKRGYNEKSYLLNPLKCKRCNTIISYQQNLDGNSYCSKGCSISESNSKRDPSVYTKQAESLKNTLRLKAEIPHIIIYKEGANTPIHYCSFCGKVMRRVNGTAHKSCSKECKSQLASLTNRGRTGGSNKQFIKVVDSFGKEVSLDSSWEVLMSEDLNSNNINWTRPSSFLLSNGRRYTPDFYLPDYQIFLDPKAYREGYLTQVAKIKQFEIEYNTTCLVISDKKLLTWNHVKSLIP